MPAVVSDTSPLIYLTRLGHFKQLNALLLIDEAAGRQLAIRLGIRVTGTLGLIIEAKARGAIPTVQEELNRLTGLTSFRIADELRAFVLRQAGELE